VAQDFGPANGAHDFSRAELIEADIVKDEERAMGDSTRRTIFRVILGFVSP
jgi:hypothetical protein